MSISRSLRDYSVDQLSLALQNPRYAEQLGITQAAAYNALKARTEEQKAVQGMMAQQAADKPSLKEQVIASSGVASVPLKQDMFKEDSFAQGGIVAFADGDQVFGRELTDEEYMSLTPQQKTAYDRQFFNTRMDRNIMKPFAAAADLATLPYNVGANLLEKGLNTLDLAGFGRMAGFYDPDVTSVRVPRADKGESLTPYYDMIRRKEMVDTSVKPNIPSSGKRPGTPAKEPILPNKPARMIAEENAAKIRQDIARGVYAPPTADVPVKGGPGGGGIAGLRPPKDIELTAPKIDESALDSLIGATPTRQTVNEMMAAERQARGIDDKFFDKQLATLEADKADIAKRRDKNLWESIAIAGLQTAAGKSQFGLQNIAEGLGVGVRNLIATDKDLRAEQRALRKEGNDILAAQQARREAQMQGDMAEFQRQDSIYRDLMGKKQQRIDTNVINAQNAANEGKKLNFDRDLKVWTTATEQAGAESRARIQAEGYNKLLQAQLGVNRFDQSAMEAQQKYINDQIKANPANVAKKTLIDKHANTDISTLPAETQKRLLEARQWYNNLTQEAKVKYPEFQGSVPGGQQLRLPSNDPFGLR